MRSYTQNMLTIKVEMAPEKEAALRKRIGKHGGPINAFLLPYLNLIADGQLVLVPQFVAPQKEAA